MSQTSRGEIAVDEIFMEYGICTTISECHRVHTDSRGNVMFSRELDLNRFLPVVVIFLPVVLIFLQELFKQSV